MLVLRDVGHRMVPTLFRGPSFPVCTGPLLVLGAVGVHSRSSVLLVARLVFSAMPTDSWLAVVDVLDLEVFFVFPSDFLAPFDVSVLTTSR